MASSFLKYYLFFDKFVQPSGYFVLSAACKIPLEAAIKPAPFQKRVRGVTVRRSADLREKEEQKKNQKRSRERRITAIGACFSCQHYRYLCLWPNFFWIITINCYLYWHMEYRIVSSRIAPEFHFYVALIYYPQLNLKFKKWNRTRRTR